MSAPAFENVTDIEKGKSGVVLPAFTSFGDTKSPGSHDHKQSSLSVEVINYKPGINLPSNKPTIEDVIENKRATPFSRLDFRSYLMVARAEENLNFLIEYNSFKNIFKFAVSKYPPISSSEKLNMDDKLFNELVDKGLFNLLVICFICR